MADSLSRNEAEPSRPRGKALRLTDEQIDAMSRVDEGDAVVAEDLWRRHCPNGFKTLLNADEAGDQ